MYNGTIRDLVVGVLYGINTTVFAYGATGSGKTYTMVGECGKKVAGRLVCGRSSVGGSAGVDGKLGRRLVGLEEAVWVGQRTWLLEPGSLNGCTTENSRIVVDSRRGR